MKWQRYLELHSNSRKSLHRLTTLLTLLVSCITNQRLKYSADTTLCSFIVVSIIKRTDFDTDIIQQSIKLLNPLSFRLTFVSPNFDTDTFETAPHYGTRYNVSKFTDDFIDVLNNTYKTDNETLNDIQLNTDLHLSTPNSFIAENVSVDRAPPTDTPLQVKILIDNEHLRLWYKKDDTFHVPKAHVYLQFTSKESYTSPLNCVLTKLIADLLKEALNEYAYNAELAGIEFTFESNTDGLLVSISII